MRIIAGEYRGRVIEAPKGMQTRPTTDRVRESLMSAISSALDGFEGLRVYDVFAGSGALGIECLSRGAAFALFSDRDSRVCSLVTGNLRSLGVPSERYKVLNADVLQRPPAVGGPFSLVLLDPPYATSPEAVRRLLENLEERGALMPEVLITYEHAAQTDISALTSGTLLSLYSTATKRYGDIAIDFLRKAES